MVEFIQFFCFSYSAKERLGFDRFNNARFLTKKVHFTEGEKGLHQVEYYLSLAGSPKNYNNNMKMFLSDSEINYANKIIKEFNSTNIDTVAIAPGGGVNPKMGTSIEDTVKVFHTADQDADRRQYKSCFVRVG